MRRLLLLVLIALLHRAGAHYMNRVDEYLSEESDEYVAGTHYEVKLHEGRQLKLSVEDLTNRKWYYLRWYHNSRPVSERTRTGCYATSVQLVCPAVSRHDGGRYELWGNDRDRNRHLVLSANVNVIPTTVAPRFREPPARVIVDVEPMPVASRDYEDCFCSGVTSRCQMAQHLYRSKHTFNLSSVELVHHFNSLAQKQIPYSAIFGTVWDGNLITAYGGYLSLPVTDECYTNRTEPCLVLVDAKNRAIGHYLGSRHDQRGQNVLMTEASWQRIDAQTVTNLEADESSEQTLDKFTFMSMLSNVGALYIRGKYRSKEGNVLTIDMVSPYDEGLGKVNTVEECLCHQGYVGLSCERCDEGYTRISEAINPNGICMSNRERWFMIKRKYNVKTQESATATGGLDWDN